MKKLDHIPSSCVGLTVHMVKVVNIVHTVSSCNGASIAKMESKIHSRPQQCHALITGYELDSDVQLLGEV